MPHTAVISKAVEKEKPVLSHPLALPCKAIRMLEQSKHKDLQWQTPVGHVRAKQMKCISSIISLLHPSSFHQFSHHYLLHHHKDRDDKNYTLS